MPNLRAAFIALSDTASGHTKMEAMWGNEGDKFDPESPSHRLMAAMLAHADQIADRYSDPKPLETPPEQILTRVQMVGADGQPLEP